MTILTSAANQKRRFPNYARTTFFKYTRRISWRHALGFRVSRAEAARSFKFLTNLAKTNFLVNETAATECRGYVDLFENKLWTV